MTLQCTFNTYNSADKIRHKIGREEFQKRKIVVRKSFKKEKTDKKGNIVNETKNTET